jgi:Zn-dependent M28 family amino/carboxypeptidase
MAPAATLSLVLALACGGADGRGEQGSGASSAVSYPRFDGAAAYDFVERQVEFGPRVPGRPGHRAMAEWVEGYLAARADTLIIQRFTHVTASGDTLPLVNFLARFRPSASASLLLLAHWDTRPVSDAAAEAEDREKPVPGANDGASGTAILLELAEMLSERPPPRGVDLLLVDGEDYGDFSEDRDVFLGSRYFALNQPDGFEAEYGVLLDMVGDRELHIYVEGNSNRLAPEVVDRVWSIAERLGFGDIFHRSTRHTIRDDHLPLNEVGIPTADIIDFDYPDSSQRYWHTPEDTPDKVSASSLGVVGTVMTRLIYGGG